MTVGYVYNLEPLVVYIYIYKRENNTSLDVAQFGVMSRTQENPQI